MELEKQADSSGVSNIKLILIITQTKNLLEADNSGAEKLVLQRSPTLQWEENLPDLEHLGNVVNVMSGRLPPQDKTEETMVRGSSTDEMAMSEELVFELFLRNAYLVRDSIGRIMDGNKPIGTGFRVSKRLIMTAANVARQLVPGNSSIQFRYYEEPSINCPAKDSTSSQRTRVKIEQETFYHINEELNYAIMATEQIVDSQVGFVKHIYVGDTERVLGKHINILSYPGGSPMKVSLRKNIVVGQPQKKKFVTFSAGFLDSAKYIKNPKMILDKADADYGSSGAPMFNDDFQLIGIHQGWTQLRVKGAEAKCICNCGCFVKSILGDMYSQVGKPYTEFEQKLKGKEAELGIPYTKNVCNFLVRS